MIKVLTVTKNTTLQDLVNDNSNGAGQLTVMNDIITEELNGIYELEFDVLTTDKHYEDLKDYMLVKVNVNEMDDEQIFRVYYISEPINFVVHVKCQHISYDLSKIVVKPFTATGAVNIKNGLVSHMLGTYPFTTWTDITNTTSTFTLDIPRTFRECLGGYEGSVLDVLRPEYEWDNLTVKMYARRGSDHGTRIAYGKNLTDFQQEENNENVYDAVYGYAVVDDVTYEATSIYNKTSARFPKVLNMDFSNRYESGRTPTGAELLQYATDYADNNDIEIPSVSMKIAFVPLWQTEEYKDIAPLERVFLGDTVHVYFDKLNVEASARVIKTKWSPSLKRYEEIELGSARANLNSVINQSVDQAIDNLNIDVEADVGYLETRLDDLTSLIANGMGLHITKDQLGRYILHNDESLANSKYQYMITANGFMMSDDFGTTWNSGWDIHGNAVMNSLSTITLNALEIYGSTITGSIINFGDLTDKYITAQPYANGITFDGTGTIRMQPKEYFYVNNLAADGTHMYNRIIMNKQGSTYQANYLELMNYDDLNGYLLANFMELDAHYYASNEYRNRFIYHNYSTASGTWYEGNYVSLSAYADRNIIYFYNYKPLNSAESGATKLVANYLQFTANSTTDGTYLYNYYISGNYQANNISLNSSANSNSSSFNNNILTGGYTANRITLSSGTSSNSLSIRNLKLGVNVTTPSTASYGNQIEMYSWTTSNEMEIGNYRPGSGDLAANRITMVGTPTGGGGSNSIYIRNYDVDGGNVANDISMSKSTNSNSFALNLRRGGTIVGKVELTRNSSGLVEITLQTEQNSTYGYSESSIVLNSNGQVKINGHTLSFSGNYVRYS